jgi:NAD(P)-dependent dehydrogenase (short-subunit alcohol dehydrogenase family)
MSPRLAGKVAIVTGAASGFGKGIAAKFIEEGARVLIADISEESGKQTAEELGCTFAVTDATRADHWQALLRQALDEFGQVDIIVNNAGTTYANKPTTSVTEKDYNLVMDVNVKSIYQSTNVMLPYFLENSRPGVFIQVSSTAALRPRPGLTWYNASKAAVSVATKTMAVEFGPRNLRFNSVCPVVGSTGL